MKHISKIFLAVFSMAAILVACDKKADLATFEAGRAAVLSSSVLTTAPVAADSNKVAIKFTWTDPGYATATSNTKYVLQIDSATHDFSKAVSRTVMAVDSMSFLAKDWNSILLGMGFQFNVAYDVDVRLVSSYGNNNDQKTSNVIHIKATPYKVPPKVALPTTLKLFIVGSATQGGWNNPVPTPSQELARLSETSWGGVFQLNAAGEFLILPINGDWNSKFAVQDNTTPGIEAGGAFGFNIGSDFSQNFKGPAAAGWYTIIFDFQLGTFTVKPYTSTFSSTLYMVGDATPGGWNNPVPVPSQQFTRLNAAQFTLTIALTAGKEYLVLPVNGDWSHKYALDDNSTAASKLGGAFKYDAGQNFKSPDVSGNYKIEVNMIDNSYKLTKL